jgi:signal transduction histidine kinase
MDISQQPLHQLSGKIRLPGINKSKLFKQQYFFPILHRIRNYGIGESMDEYEKRKLGIFNLINFFQILTGLLIPLTGIFLNNQLPFTAWLVACVPVLVSVLVLYLNKTFKNDAARIVYFLLYPFATCVGYLYGINPGLDLCFIFFGILAVFFLKDIGYMIFSISFSMVSYYVLSVVLKDYHYPLERISKGLYLINQGLAILFIFYGLYLIKKENSVYQLLILDRNRDLHLKNEHITLQAEKIKETANLLKKQTEELTELNILKNKLFSIISHDLKAPLYALRHLFTNVQQENISLNELKKSIPEVVKDLNYTTELMDNLLQWAKTQMQANVVRAEKTDLGKLTEDVLQLLRLQSERKKIRIEYQNSNEVYDGRQRSRCWQFVRASATARYAALGDKKLSRLSSRGCGGRRMRQARSRRKAQLS